MFEVKYSQWDDSDVRVDPAPRRSCHDCHHPVVWGTDLTQPGKAAMQCGQGGYALPQQLTETYLMNTLVASSTLQGGFVSSTHSVNDLATAKLIWQQTLYCNR